VWVLANLSRREKSTTVTISLRRFSRAWRCKGTMVRRVFSWVGYVGREKLAVLVIFMSPEVCCLHQNLI